MMENKKYFLIKSEVVQVRNDYNDRLEGKDRMWVPVII